MISVLKYTCNLHMRARIRSRVLFVHESHAIYSRSVSVSVCESVLICDVFLLRWIPTGMVMYEYYRVWSVRVTCSCTLMFVVNILHCGIRYVFS